MHPTNGRTSALRKPGGLQELKWGAAQRSFQVTRLPLRCILCLLASCTRAREQRVVPKLVVSMVVPCGAPNAGEPLDFGGQNQQVCLDRSPIVTEADVRSARLEKGIPGSPVVRLSLRHDAAERLREATAEHVHEQVGIILKGKPFSTPVIQEPISEMYLAHAFTQAQATELVREFNSGNRE